MQAVIVIPARYQSTRLPKKPLMLIAGQSLLSRVIERANEAAAQLAARGISAQVLVATDHPEIEAHAQGLGAQVAMTDPELPSGSDRALAAVSLAELPADVVVNLQGDSPFMPADFITEVVSVFEAEPEVKVSTPAAVLSWDELDELREAKRSTPFSGTTVTVDSRGYALWFSKQIIPAIRAEARLRSSSSLSPVRQHLGLYAFARSALEDYCALPRSRYEKLEGLEQLRLLENRIPIRVLDLDFKNRLFMSGIDSPEDVERAERLLEGARGSGAGDE